MGREQSEKLNTSPSRGSGYQVINDLFDRNRILSWWVFAEKLDPAFPQRRKF